MHYNIGKIITLYLLLDGIHPSYASGLRSAATLSPRPAVFLINTTDEILAENSLHNRIVSNNNDTILPYLNRSDHSNLTTTEYLDEQSVHNVLMENKFNLTKTENVYEQSVHDALIESKNTGLHSSSERTEHFHSYVQWAEGCGGTLIYEDIVLSAAHCYSPRGRVSERVWVGSKKFRDGEQRKIVDFIPHPKYSAETYQYDFLILKLETPVIGQTANLNTLRGIPMEDDVLTVLGFEKKKPETNDDNRQVNFILQEVEVNFFLLEECKRLYGEYNVNGRVNICAEIGDKDLCEGENSGGPIFSSDGVQVGVASWNNGCNQVGYPAVYARISHAYPWIENQICIHSSNPPSECTPISISFLSDEHPSEIRWSIKGDDDDGNKNYEHTMYYSYLNVKPNGYMEKHLMLLPGSYRFEIVDTYGDGMKGGGYSIWTGKNLIERSGDFDAFDSVEFAVESGGAKRQHAAVEELKVVKSSTQTAMTSVAVRSLQQELQEKLHSIDIEIKFDEKPTETSWSLFRKLPEITEIYTEPFNGTHVPSSVMRVIVEDLINGEYWFRILDSEYNGLCCVNGEGSYKITDTTDGKNEVIHESNGEFFWYEMVEFKLAF